MPKRPYWKDDLCRGAAKPPVGWGAGRTHQSSPVPPLQPGAGTLQGMGHLPGDGPRTGWDVGPIRQVPWLGRAVGSWRWALLRHRWGRDGQGWWHPRGCHNLHDTISKNCKQERVTVLVYIFQVSQSPNKILPATCKPCNI